MYPKLGAPDATYAALSLTVTLNPAPDKQVAPTALGWQLAYSCPASE
jgi:hypothetical protein